MDESLTPSLRKRRRVDTYDTILIGFDSSVGVGVDINESLLLNAVLQLKKAIVSSDRADSLLSRSTFVRLIQLVDICTQHIIVDNMDLSSAWNCALKEVLSVIANCCHLSIAVCLEMKNCHSKFINLLGDFLRNTHMSESVKATSIRIIANLCQHKETTLPIVQTSSLLERLCSSCDSDCVSMRKNALLAVRRAVLLGNSFARSILASNGAYHIGQSLTHGYEIDTSSVNSPIAILLRFAHLSIKDTGRQLAKSGCITVLLDATLIDTNNTNSIQLLLVELCTGSFQIREELVAINAIQRIITTIDSSSSSMFVYRILAAFAQDAFGRVELRETGALDKIVSRLFAESDHRQLHQLFGTTFKWFIHDRCGMLHLSKNETFMQLIVRRLQLYCDHRHQLQCCPSTINDSEYRPDSPSLIAIRHKLETDQRMDIDDDQPLCKSFGNAMVGIRSWSPSMSPIGSFGSSSPTSTSAVSDDNDNRAMSPSSIVIDQLDVPTSTDHDDQVTLAQINKDLMIDGVFLLSWLSHSDDTLIRLIRIDIIDVLIETICTAASEIDSKIIRILKRIARHRSSIDILIDIDFDDRIIRRLMRSSCLLMRNDTKCTRCDQRLFIGRELINELGAHVDSDFGAGILAKLLTTKRCVRAACTTAVFIRSHRRIRLFNDCHALDILFNALRQQLIAETMDDHLICRIIYSLRELITITRLRSYFATSTTIETSQCQLMNDNSLISNDALITFRFPDTSIIIQMLKSRLCTASRYFDVMFTSQFIEMNRNEFIFDADREHCHIEDYIRLLHYLAGCSTTAECVHIDSSTSCLAAITLADRYLCVDLIDALLCSETGCVHRFIDASNLVDYFGVALAVKDSRRLFDICIAAMFAFGSDGHLMDVMQLIRSQSSAYIRPFIEHLTRFVNMEIS